MIFSVLSKSTEDQELNEVFLIMEISSFAKVNK